MKFFNLDNYNHDSLNEINNILDESGPEYFGAKYHLNEMSYNQRKFINSLIQKYKPKKIL